MSWWCPKVFFDGEDAFGGVYPEIETPWSHVRSIHSRG
jgi:hypothetical protein